MCCGQDVLNNIKRLSIEKKDCGRRSILTIGNLADGYVVDGVLPSVALTEDFHVRRGWDLHLANQNPDTAHCVQSPTKKASDAIEDCSAGIRSSLPKTTFDFPCDSQ
jgi:hypothetical protein